MNKWRCLEWSRGEGQGDQERDVEEGVEREKIRIRGKGGKKKSKLKG